MGRKAISWRIRFKYMEGKLGRLQQAVENFRSQRRASLEAGHTPEPISPFIQDQIPEDQEIILLVNPDWMVDVARYNEIYNQSVTYDEDPRLDPA